jgi:hypothetical protein
MRNRTLTIAAAPILLTGWLVVPGLASPPWGSLLNRILGYRTWELRSFQTWSSVPLFKST